MRQPHQRLLTAGLPGIVVASLLAGACSRGAQESDTKAVVTHDQYAAAYDIISAIDYLPFEYTADGCYARALYMSMELAAKGIPSSSVYAVPTNRADLQLKDGTSWIFHVAPMLKDGPDAVETVVDPAMKVGPYLSMDDWKAAMEFAKADIRITHVQGSVYDRIPEADEPIIDNFAALNPFTGASIVDACNDMYGFLGWTTLDAAEQTKRRDHLIQRTLELETALAGNGKLTGEDDLKEATCGGKSIAMAPDAKK